MREIITAPEVVRIADSGETRLVVASDAIVTLAAKDEAERLGIDVVREHVDHQPSDSHDTSGALTDEQMANLIGAIVSRVVDRLSEAENGIAPKTPDTAIPEIILRSKSEGRQASTKPERSIALPSNAGVRTPQIIAFDAGGTMTDAFIIDENGQFVVGKAQTTPDDESISVLASTKDALTYWDMSSQEAVPTIVSGVFSGTSMLNRLLSRQGERIGIITNKGTESILKLGRGIQSYLGYSYSDRLHVNSHAFTEPLVPRDLIVGVTERVDHKGEVVIPLYEHEVAAAATSLIDAKVSAIVVCFLHSYVNPSHERRTGAIISEVIARHSPANVHGSPQVFLSCEYYPVRGELPRLNTVVIEAYAAEPSRKHLGAVDTCLKNQGAKFDLRVMASHGGTISTNAKDLARTLVSGPIGGIVGAKFLGEHLDIKNIACTDIGGTTFDMGLITNGEFAIDTHPSLGSYLLAVPMVAMNSVGSGTGSFVRIDPIFGSIQIGPDSAGSRIGLCNPDSGLDTVSVTDCHIVLGLLDPDYFLGGDVTLDPELARHAVETQLAKPLGLDVYKAAAGVIELLDAQLRNSLESLILQGGYSPSQYVMMSYGGGGPVHAVGLARDLGFADILAPTWAAGFSAFGCAAADFEYRADRTMDIAIGPDSDAEDKREVAKRITEAWAELEQYVEDEFKKSGFDRGVVKLRRFLQMQYQGQLNDIDFEAPLDVVREPQDVDRLVEAFEKTYGEVFVDAARSPELGWAVTGVTVRGGTEVQKPHIPEEPITGPTPPSSARKGTRRVFWQRDWIDAEIFQMEEMTAGNQVDGLAIIESPATTLVVPPGFEAALDSHRIFHLKPSIR